MKRFIALTVFASTAVLTGGVGVVSADPPSGNNGCLADWNPASAVSDAAIKRDRNDDGMVCFKEVKGKGNGDFLITGVVVKDNNSPASAGS